MWVQAAHLQAVLLRRREEIASGRVVPLCDEASLDFLELGWIQQADELLESVGLVLLIDSLAVKLLVFVVRSWQASHNSLSMVGLDRQR